jgi:hypothetical protein
MAAEYPGKSDHQRAAESFIKKSSKYINGSCKDLDELDRYFKENRPGYAGESLATTPFEQINFGEEIDGQ